MDNLGIDGSLKIRSDKESENVDKNASTSWSNYDNSKFYELVKSKKLQSIAEHGGLSNCCDLEVAMPYWRNSNSILEVGAGYGRVIDHMLSKGFSGKITAIERIKSFFQILQSKYDDKVRLLNIDLHDLSCVRDSFDTILFLWSGIAEFTLKEQEELIKNLAKLLNKGGYLIIDNLSESTDPFGIKQVKTKKDYCFKLESAKIYINKSSIEEIDNCAKAANFSNIKHITYQTDTGRPRVMHILTK